MVQKVQKVQKCSAVRAVWMAELVLSLQILTDIQTVRGPMVFRKRDPSPDLIPRKGTIHPSLKLMQ